MKSSTDDCYDDHSEAEAKPVKHKVSFCTINIIKEQLIAKDVLANEECVLGHSSSYSEDAKVTPAWPNPKTSSLCLLCLLARGPYFPEGWLVFPLLAQVL